MLSCCTGNAAVVSDDVQVAEDDPAPKETKPKTGEDTFVYRMERSSQETPWGVDLTSDSGYSLTVVAVSPEGALGKCNATAPMPLKPGDVIVSIGAAQTKVAMVETLRAETVVMADVVRNSKFE